MQDNEPLMRALAKLVAVNNPDKIIFVGEALVGNEAVDQLSKFNQSLKDFSGMQNPRHIDGMILTKFDTIDDKVSMEWCSAIGWRSVYIALLSRWAQLYPWLTSLANPSTLLVPAKRIPILKISEYHTLLIAYFANKKYTMLYFISCNE